MREIGGLVNKDLSERGQQRDDQQENQDLFSFFSRSFRAAAGFYYV